MKTAIQDSYIIIENINKESKKWRDDIFGNSILKFRKTKETSKSREPGQLVLGSFKESPRDSTHFNKIYFKEIINKLAPNEVDIICEYLSEDRFFVAFLDLNNKLQTFLINERGEIVRSVFNLINDFPISSFRACASNDSIFFVLKPESSDDKHPRLYVFDHGLRCLRKTTTDLKNVISINADKSFLHVFFHEGAFVHIKTYNEDLEAKNLVKIEETDLEHIKIFRSKPQIFHQNAYGVFRSGIFDNIDITSGNLVRSFSVGNVKSFSIVDDEIFLLDEDQQELKVYDMNFEFLRKVHLTTDTSVDMVLSNNVNFCLYDSKNCIFYSLPDLV